MGFDFELYLYVVIGIIISIVLPIIKAMLPKQGTMNENYWPLVKPYVVIGIFSLLTGVLIVAFLGDALDGWQIAIISGYAWDSTLQKVGT